MGRKHVVLVVALITWISLPVLGGCAAHDATPRPEVRPGVVTDMPAFKAFIAARPTPEEFRRVYPGVLLVMPGDIATREYRTDNSRYFARLDEVGRIMGGVFQ